MELSKIAKAKVKQSDVAAAVKNNPGKSAEELATNAVRPPAPPGTPANKIKPWHLKAPKYVAGGLAAGAAGGGGLYLYKRKRAEKSLSSMR